MGTFVNFTGDMSVPEEEMELSEFMKQVLEHGNYVACGVGF